MYAWGNTRHGKLGVSSPTTVENLLVPTALEIVKGKKVMQAACGSNFSILLAMMDRIDDKDEGSLINLKDVLIRSAEKAKPKIARKRGTLSSHRIASSARCLTRVELTARSCVCSLVCLFARSASTDDGDDTSDFRVKVHLFEKLQFHRPLWCMHCSKFMWGIRRGHYKCSGTCASSSHRSFLALCALRTHTVQQTGCGFLAHAKCKDLVTSECIAIDTLGQEANEARPSTHCDRVE